MPWMRVNQFWLPAITWVRVDEPAATIYNRFRAFDPWPGITFGEFKLTDVRLAEGSGPPRTWDELLAYAERLTVRRADGSPVRAGFSLRMAGFKAGTAEKWLKQNDTRLKKAAKWK